MQKIKESRKLSFLFITLVYIVATLGALIIYPILSTPWWLSLLIVDIISTVIVFLFSLFFENASVYDPYWSVQPIVIVLAYAIGKPLTLFRVLLIIAVLSWGTRLTANWAYTFYGLNHQDWRYTMLKEKTGKIYPLVNFVGIHMVPTLVVYLCCLPLGYAFQNDIRATDWSVVFIALSFGATALQGVADFQMHRYRKNKTTTFIREGVWKHSRHPNYLGEILMWWGIGLSVFMAADFKWFLLLGALANTLLFFFVSIPLADQRQAKKEGFQEYKEETNKLLPFPKIKK